MPKSDIIPDIISNKKLSGVGGGATPPPQAGAMDSITMATSSPDPKDLGRAYGCLWTLFQYDKYLEKLRDYAQNQCTYAVWGFEICPDTGRPHLQGYIHWENKRSIGKFSTDFGNCRVAKPDGTARQNREYCLKIRSKDKKPNEKFEEYGTMPTQGHRTDWEKAVNDIRNGESIEDVITAQPQLLPCQRALREFKSMMLKPNHRSINVVVLWGKGGTGKTRWAFDNYPDLYKKPTGDWWDGYSGQKTILLDDYYGYIKYHDLLTVLDRYPLNLPYKGGFIWAQYDTVIITSNKHPADWYQKLWGWPLRRRLDKIIEVSVIDGETHYEAEDFPASEAAWRAQEEAYAFDP